MTRYSTEALYRQIVREVKEGKSVKQAALRLVVSPWTAYRAMKWARERGKARAQRD